MTVVAILHTAKPNRLTAAANRADTPWFAANRDRDHYVRRATPIERQQAGCLHGTRLPVGQEWFVAARRVDFGLIERRFLLIANGGRAEFDEATARWLFDGALIAGAAPQHEPEPEPSMGAA